MLSTKAQLIHKREASYPQKDRCCDLLSQESDELSTKSASKLPILWITFQSAITINAQRCIHYETPFVQGAFIM
ncbi:MAG TPA: hypothetical protein VF099_06140, partial [Ktedonobacterales bacterium]